MTDIVPRSDVDSWAQILGPVGDLASKIAATEFAPKSLRGRAPAVAAAILAGRERGLPPMVSLASIDVVDGRPTLSAQLLTALIYRAGHRITVIESTDKAAEVRIERADGLGEATVRWTMADAQRAGLAGKRNWQQYGRQMLWARALSECARMVAPDVALGLDVAADPDVVQQPPPRSATTVVQVEQMPPTRVVEAAVAPEAPDPAPASTPAMNALRAVLPEAADIIEGTIEPDPEPERRMITRPQLRKIGALIGDLERQEGRKIDRDERRWLIADMAGIADPGSLASANDLTAEQASAAIDTLTARLTVEDPPVEPVADADGVIA